MKDIKKKIGLALAVTAALAGVFWWGGNAPGLRGWTAGQQPAAAVTAPPTAAPAPKPTRVPAVPTPWGTLAPAGTPAVSGGAETPAPAAPTHRPGGAAEGLTGAEKLVLAEKRAGGTSGGAVKGDPDYSAAHGMLIDKATGKDKYLTDPVPEGRPLPVEPENAAVSDRAFTCTLSIRCDTVLENPDWLDPEKVELVPEDGVILPPTEVTFYEGESVFNLLQRETRDRKIHMEFVNAPLYNSAYIEGIHNLYEFDCGELSGWMYKVNDWFPNYGCSRYVLKQGDTVEWVYTCDLGIDVGGFAAAGR